jgi:hypothetical protein
MSRVGAALLDLVVVRSRSTLVVTRESIVNIVSRFLNFLRRRYRSLVQPVLSAEDQQRLDAERSSDGTGHGGFGPR